MFHLTRYSWIGVVVGGCEAIRCAVACELWPWGITGRSKVEASAQILSVSLMPPHQ